MQICYILSSKAGAGACLAYRRLLSDMHCHHTADDYAANSSIEIKLTTNDHDVYAFAYEFALRTQEDGVVYVLGGDGSLNEAAQALAHTRCALGVIPLGTANDFARQLYGMLPHKRKDRQTMLKSLLQQSMQPQIMPIDLIRFTCDDRHHPHGYCINVMGLGLDSQIMVTAYHLLKRFPKSPRLAYTAATLREMLKLNSFDIHMQLTHQDGTQERMIDRMMLAALCNSGFYGNGYHPAPKARIDDGVMNVTMGQKMSLPQFMRVAPAYKAGTHEGMSHVNMHNDIVSMSIQSIDRQPIPANFDGTRLAFTQMTAEIDAGALRLAYPKMA